MLTNKLKSKTAAHLYIHTEKVQKSMALTKEATQSSTTQQHQNNTRTGNC